MTCYYCISNIKDEICVFDIDGYPLPTNAECRHFEFDTGREDLEIAESMGWALNSLFKENEEDG